MNNSILKSSIFSGAFILLLAVAFSFAQMESGTQSGKNGAKTWQMESITAVITNIDKNNNEVTLKDENGNTFMVTVDKKIDLSQLNNGDKVNVEMYRSLATDFHAPSQEEIDNPLVITDQTVEAPEGTEPSAGNLRQIRAVVKIEDIDEDDQTVRVKGPQGNEFTLFVQNPSILDRLKEGDSMTVTYSQALAVSLIKER